VDPVPDPIFLRKSGSARTRTWNLWIYSQELWPLDYRRSHRSRSRNYFTTDSQSVSTSWYRVCLWDLRPYIISCRNVTVWNLRCCTYGAPSLTRGWVCNLQCNRSKVRVAQNPKPYSTVSSETPPNLEGQVPVFISPTNRVVQLYPRALGSLYVVSHDSQGYGGGISF
jgi:hypothetical protein